MKLEDIKVGRKIDGLSGDGYVTIRAVTPRGADAVELVFERLDGSYHGQLLYRDDAANLHPAQSRPSFDADIVEFRLASEARRILDAAKYDQFLSVSTSDVRPLPHQLKAVYQDLLPRIPLRFLLADDPGAGKTIMAGLYIKQLILRDDVRRCLIVAPGGLVEQWQDELGEKFGLEFMILTNDLINSQRAGSVFDSHPLLIARMDHLARNDDLLEQLSDSDWDLVVVDEAHRMSAHIWGKETKKSKRFELGELLRDRTQHLLLMTATPHSGKEEDFQLFLSLLDPDTFGGRQPQGTVKLDPSAFMRRMVKEDLVTLEGKRLFPERVASTVEYELSPEEQDLYEQVSEYVRTEMNRADKLDGKRKNTVGFALTILQRRLASSPEAIYQSLRRRSARLRQRRDDIANGVSVRDDLPADFDEDAEAFPSGEYEELADQVLDSATSARTVQELDAELVSLDHLTQVAQRLRDSRRDVKWNQLSSIIQNDVLVSGGRKHKLIIFTEHRDTLEYLRQRIGTLVGDPRAVVAIHGGVNRRERRRVTAEFTHNDDVQFLVATDAAGEGLNLQAAHLMVNYDLPWNPNRIEQRFGRIHRIGQEDVCQLWNLVAINTREGDVYRTLLHKLEEMSLAYQGKVFDVLGEAFEDGRSLKELLLEAIRYGDDPEIRERMTRVVDSQAGEGIRELLEKNDLDHDHLTRQDVDDMRLEYEDAYARRLAPHFIHDAFGQAFKRLGGRWTKLGPLSYEIKHVPSRFRRAQLAIATSYECVTFDPADIEGPDGARAALLTPGQPLLDEVLGQAAQEFGPALTRGVVLSSTQVTRPQLLVGLAQEVVDGRDEVIDRRFQHLYVDEDGAVTSAGIAPHLDLNPAPGRHDEVTALDWLGNATDRALEYAVSESIPAQLAALRPARESQMDRLWEAIYSRLSKEINDLSQRAAQASEDELAGREVKQSCAQLEARITELKERRNQRERIIQAQRALRGRPPKIVSYAVVLPEQPSDPLATTAIDTTISERRAVEKVLVTERALGRQPHEQPHFNEGFDVLSLVDGGEAMFIEVKGRVKGAQDFTITRSEVMLAQNKQPNYRLALVAVDPDDPDKDEIVYLDDPFDGVSFGNYTTGTQQVPWKQAWARGREPF